MAQSAATVRADFDRLARLEKERNWNHNDHYHAYLISHLPADCRCALDVGCGSGSLARQLARRCESVLGLDLSPEMVRLARERSGGYPNVGFEVADVLAWDLPREEYDCIASVATLHHVPLETTLAKMRDALSPRGRLLVLDLYKAESLADFAVCAVAIPANMVLKLRRTGRLREPLEVRQAWEDHGRTDRYLTLRQVRRVCDNVIPGARVKRHLLWRYSIVWEKPHTLTHR